MTLAVNLIVEFVTATEMTAHHRPRLSLLASLENRLCFTPDPSLSITSEEILSEPIIEEIFSTTGNVGSLSVMCIYSMPSAHKFEHSGFNRGGQIAQFLLDIGVYEIHRIQSCR